MLYGSWSIAQQPAIDPSLEIAIVSSKDGSPQRAIFYVPPGAAATAAGPKAPLVVFLHSWSTDYTTVGPALEESKRRGWVFVGPNFRGPNESPEACASDLAVQDILDSVERARKQARVDPQRIYLVGSSGGGHMALLMATRAPALWSAVSTWVPITDLAAWYEFSKATGSQYYRMMDQCMGGSPEAPKGRPSIGGDRRYLISVRRKACRSRSTRAFATGMRERPCRSARACWRSMNWRVRTDFRRRLSRSRRSISLPGNPGFTPLSRKRRRMKRGAGKLYCSGGARGRFVSPYLMAPIR